MLLLVTRGIFKYDFDTSSDGMVYITAFHDDRFAHSSNIKIIAPTVVEAAVLVLLKRGI
jgi:hypothetical protein